MLTDISAASSDYRRDLGDGLILRWSTAADTENLAQLCGMVFRDKEADPPNEGLANWIRDLMSDRDPVMGSGDYGLIEDLNKEGNPVVACVCLMRLEWQYEGIAFPMGRPEIVASHPEYRKRGLVRKIFEMVHARSEAEGHMLQAITGISYFYRQFGYEYALDLGGKRVLALTSIPKAKEGELEPYTLRDATVDDIPLMLESYDARRAQSIVSTTITEKHLRYQFEKWEEKRPEGKLLSCQVIIDKEGNFKGFLRLPEKRWWRGLGVWWMEFLPGTNIHALMPSLLRGLRAYGEQLPPAKEDTETFSEIHLDLGVKHPFYDVLGNLAPYSEDPYAWYVRVPDLPAFIKHIAPVLEKRLATSPLVGHTGEIKINFYRGGLRLAFEDGRLTTAEDWRAPIYGDQGGAESGFPPLVFLQLLFGRRSLDQLRSAYPDVWSSQPLLLNTLFPARPSSVTTP